MRYQIAIMMHGLTGTGKSTIAQKIGTSIPHTVVLHSAIIRQELKLHAPLIDKKSKHFEFGGPYHLNTVSPIVYQELVGRASQTLNQKKHVVIDASFSRQWQRQLVYNLFRQFQTENYIISCTCPDEIVLKTRITTRKGKEKSDPLCEASSWNTYLHLLHESDPLQEDFASSNKSFPLKAIYLNTLRPGDLKINNVGNPKTYLSQPELVKLLSTA